MLSFFLLSCNYYHTCSSHSKTRTCLFINIMLKSKQKPCKFFFCFPFIDDDPPKVELPEQLQKIVPATDFPNTLTRWNTNEVCICHLKMFIHMTRLVDKSFICESNYFFLVQLKVNHIVNIEVLTEQNLHKNLYWMFQTLKTMTEIKNDVLKSCKQFNRCYFH